MKNIICAIRSILSYSKAFIFKIKSLVVIFLLISFIVFYYDFERVVLWGFIFFCLCLFLLKRKKLKSFDHRFYDSKDSKQFFSPIDGKIVSIERVNADNSEDGTLLLKIKNNFYHSKNLYLPTSSKISEYSFFHKEQKLNNKRLPLVGSHLFKRDRTYLNKSFVLKDKVFDQTICSIEVSDKDIHIFSFIRHLTLYVNNNDIAVTKSLVGRLGYLSSTIVTIKIPNSRISKELISVGQLVKGADSVLFDLK